MENLEEIKKQLAELSEKFETDYKLMKNNMMDVSYRLNQLPDNSEFEYVFTEKEMIKFVEKLHEGFEESLEYNLSNISFDTDSVSLSLNDKEIEVEIDSDDIRDTIISELDFDLDEDSIKDTIADIYKYIKK